MHFFQASPTKGADFMELRAYLVAKLMWNTSADFDSVMRAFLNGYYGEPAAPYLYSYLKEREEALVKSKISLWIYDTPITHKNGMLKKEMMARYRELFDKAEEAAAGNQTFLARVREARLPVMHAELEIARTEQDKDMGALAELLNLFRDRAEEYGVTMVNEGSNTVKEYCELYARRYMADNSKNLAFGCPVTYLLPPDSPYDKIAAKALTDGLYGGGTFNESWVGWEGRDAEFVIDLGEIKQVQNVEADFLLKRGSWILMPKRMSCHVSTDNITYQPIGYKDVAEDRYGGIKYVPVSIPAANGMEARYIKVKIETIGLCPPWHAGVGYPAWFFIDEINVY
jgi:hypothetical protein